MIEVVLFTLAAAILAYIMISSLIFDEVAQRERIIADLRAQVAAHEAERAKSLFRRPARSVA